MNKLPPKVEERFDKRFPLEYFSFSPYLDKAPIEIHYTFWQEKATNLAKHLREEFKNFLAQELAKRDEEILKNIPSFIFDNYLNEDFKKGWNSAVKNIKANLIK